MPKAWLYCLESDYTFKHSMLNGIEFKSKWVTISKGKMTIKACYAWDGCSPRYHVAGLFSIGVPNGILRLGKPWTYWASLVHDVLCQFRKLIKISKRVVVQIFDDILKRDKWPLRRPYVKAVDWFGPQDFLLN